VNNTQHGIQAASTQPKKASADAVPLSAHLRELRNRLIICILALAVATVVGWAVHGWLLEQLTAPACALTHVHGVGQPTKQCPNGLLVNTGILSPVSLTFKVSFTAGVILASPVWSYQLWAFVAPGLYKKEKRYSLGFAAVAVPMFCLGAWLAYLVFPRGLQVLAGFNPAGFSLALPGNEFLDFFQRTVLVFGLSFELPLLLVLLNFVGIVSAARLRSWWRPSVFLIFVFAAVAIPTGDPFTLIVLAVPICLLFFAALAVTTVHDRAKTRSRAADKDGQLSDVEASPLGLASPLPGAVELQSPEAVDTAGFESVSTVRISPDDSV
jgi:sec-independent protein translocase protein TatC